jgi:diaminopimelate decarboxylase
MDEQASFHTSQHGPGALWWMRRGLEPVGGRLTICGRDAEDLAREHGTPLFVYDLTRIEENVRAVQGALARTGLPYRFRLALKAQREPEVLARVRAIGAPGTPDAVGLDVCSPGEVEHSLAHGFLPDEISYTGTNVSERDLDVILSAGVHINLDLVTQIHRYGRRAPGTSIGLRLNPRVSAVDPTSGSGYYSGDRPTKFGIYAEQLEAAVAAARTHDLTIDTAHFHVANQLFNDGLPAFERAVERVAAMVRRLQALGCPIAEVNAGGGLGNSSQPGREQLDLDAYAGILARHFGPLGVTVACEPGESISSGAGTMLAEVVTVEDRSATGDGSAMFAGVDCGWNVMNGVFVYHCRFEPIVCRAADAPPTHRYTIAGHINEGPDLFAEDQPLPEVREGDIIAIPGVGAYYQATWHTHCMRPFPAVVWFDDRL